MIMSQIISFQEEVRERLGAIEVRLKKMEKGKGREGDADEEDTQRLDEDVNDNEDNDVEDEEEAVGSWTGFSDDCAGAGDDDS